METEADIFNEVEDEDILYTTQSKPEFGYEDLSLDDIIKLKHRNEESIASVTEESESVPCGFGGIRYGYDDTVGFRRSSPVHILKLLSEDHGKIVEMSAKELCLNEFDDKRNTKGRRWRVTWTHGGVTGVGEAPRKMMAMHVAALDMVESLRIKYPAYNLGDCEIPRGTLINPFVFRLLDEKCAELGFEPPTFEINAQTNNRGWTEFTALCFVDDEVFVGKSYDEFFAKRYAAKKAYETLIEQAYPDDRIIRGGKCLNENEQKYNDIESEASHVYCIYEKPAKRMRLAGSSSGSLMGSLSSSLTSLTSSVTGILRPARIRPPPIITPNNLHLGEKQRSVRFTESLKNIFGSTSDEIIGNIIREPMQRIVVESPTSFGDMSDDEEEDFFTYSQHVQSPTI